MKNTDKLFTANPKALKNPLLNKSGLHFVTYDTELTGDSIRKIISFINGVRRKYKSAKIPIYLEFKSEIKLIDKLTYVILECICYSLIKNYGYTVYIYWSPKEDILTDGITSSPLLLINSSKKESQGKFTKKFMFDTYKRHYRRVVSSDKGDSYLSVLLDEVSTFLKSTEITEESQIQISEVVSELIGNACEHASTDCLLDIDVTDSHGKKIDGIVQEGKYVGVNIAIINFSDKLFSSDLRMKMSEHDIPKERYEKLKVVHENHQKKIDSEKYTEEDFWNIACLQDKISGRLEYLSKHQPGGTGSIILVKSLQEKADNDNCYLLSGGRVIFFIKDLLSYDSHGWLSFNSENDFMNYIPDEGVIDNCPIKFPGTAYNLNFIMKTEEII